MREENERKKLSSTVPNDNSKTFIHIHPCMDGSELEAFSAFSIVVGDAIQSFTKPQRFYKLGTLYWVECRYKYMAIDFIVHHLRKNRKKTLQRNSI